MPKRSNIFQDVVAIIHEHMAGDAVVEESAMLRHPDTGEPREVDVVIRSNVAGHEVIVSVEATAAGRKADTTWVERLIQKHRKLPTSKLVLVSQSGFTEAARIEAAAEKAVPLAPEDLDSDDPTFVVVNALPSLWPKQLTLAPENAVLIVRKPDGTRLRIREVPPDGLIYLADGQVLCAMVDFFNSTYAANSAKLTEMVGLAQMTEDLDRFFVFGVGPPVIVQVSGKEKHLCLRWEQSNPPELHEIAQADFTGKATVRVGEIPLHHKRLGEVTYAYGEGKVGDEPVLLVVSEDEGGGKVTIRPRPASP